MADTCFADYSSLGVGIVNSYENELTEAPEEEEGFDLLNDETFGDIVEDDFDWEEQTEKFAEVLESEHLGHNDSGFNTAERIYKTQEEDMEHTINQLMIDDDDKDPVLSKSKPIPKVVPDLDSLFGPSSPPSLLDTEHLVSPSSKNIWGTPHVEVYPQRQTTVNDIQSLFDFAKSANADSPISHLHGPHSRQFSIVLPKAQTLEEIENSLLLKPILTAEELERQLRGETACKSSSPLLNGHPATPTHYRFPPPSSVMSHPRTVKMPSSSSGIMGIVSGQRSPLLGAVSPIGSAPGRMGLASLVGTPLKSVPLSVTPVSQGSAPLYMSPGTSINRQSPVTPGRGYSKPISIPQGGRCAPTGSPFNSPQALFGSPQGSYQSPQNQRLKGKPWKDETKWLLEKFESHDQASRQCNALIASYSYDNVHYYQSPDATSRRGMRPRSPHHTKSPYQHNGIQQQQYKKEHRYYRPPYNQKLDSYNGADPETSDNNEDEYAGLMIQKEKEWIIKIQLLQLQTDDPYLNDYYYTSHCMKKQAKEREKDGGDTEVKVMVPAMSRVENKVYQPAHFEGSLGRLTTSSIHNPRQIISLLAKSVSESEGSNKMPSNVGKELRKSRQLLMDIEKGYNILLYIDDIEKNILSLSEEMRKFVFEERGYNIDLLFHYLLCDGNSVAFMQYMNIRKGRNLTRRALPLLDKVQSLGIVSLICKNLQQLMKKDQTDEKLEDLFEPCIKVIETCNLASLVMYAEDIQHEESPSSTKPIAIALQSKFGCSILCTLLHQGKKIYETTSPVDMDSNLQNKWCEFVHDFASVMTTIPMESIAAPLKTYADIYDHLEHILNKRLIADVEDKLQVLTQEVTVHET